MSTILSSTGKGIKNFWSGTKKFFGGSKKSVSSLGILDTFSTFWFSLETDVNKRIDKTDKFFLSKTGEKVYFEDKKFKIPDFLNRDKKAVKKHGVLTLSVKGKIYNLKPIRQGGKQIQDAIGNKLYEIVKLRDGIKELDKFKDTKAYAVWINNNNEISDVNIPNQSVKYNFQGEIKSFQNVDRDPSTKQINYLTSLVTWPLGISASIIKWCGYKPTNFVFNTVPKILNRVIIPIVSFAVFVPIFIIGKPISLLTERSADQFSSFFKKVWDFNKTVLTMGLTNHIKENICDQSSIDVQIKAIEDGSLEGSKSGLYIKKGCLMVLNGISHTLQGINIVISNITNIVSSYLKGIGNTFLAVVHQDDKFWQAAKFLFTEPFKIAKDELTAEFQSKQSNTHAKDYTHSRNREIQSSSDKQFKHEAGLAGQNLLEAGVKQEGRVAYNTSIPHVPLNKAPGYTPAIY
jgi:hypothetical protein